MNNMLLSIKGNLLASLACLCLVLPVLLDGILRSMAMAAAAFIRPFHNDTGDFLAQWSLKIYSDAEDVTDSWGLD